MEKHPSLIVGFELCHPNARAPTYAHPGDAGADLYAAHFEAPAFVEINLQNFRPRGNCQEWLHRAAPAAIGGLPILDKSVKLNPGRSVLVHTELAVLVPDGWEMSVRPRSGLAFKNGVITFLPLGTLDSSYRGKVDVLLINWSGTPYTINKGDRIAQAVFTPVGRASFVPQDVRSDRTERGQGGFGSSDKAGEGKGPC